MDAPEGAFRLQKCLWHWGLAPSHPAGGVPTCEGRVFAFQQKTACKFTVELRGEMLHISKHCCWTHLTAAGWGSSSSPHQEVISLHIPEKAMHILESRCMYFLPAGHKCLLFDTKPQKTNHHGLDLKCNRINNLIIWTLKTFLSHLLPLVILELPTIYTSFLTCLKSFSSYKKQVTISYSKIFSDPSPLKGLLPALPWPLLDTLSPQKQLVPAPERMYKVVSSLYYSETQDSECKKLIRSSWCYSCGVTCNKRC